MNGPRAKALHHHGDVCQHCGVVGSDEAKTEAHHIDLDPTNNDPSNLSVLCAECHRKMHAGRKRGQNGAGNSYNEKRRRVQRNVSLQPDHELAIRFLADEANHEIPSRAVQELIEREMFARFGRNWREELRERVVTLPVIEELETALAS